MGVTLKRERDGVTIRPWWYAEYRRPDGTRTVPNLKIRVEGKPPANGSMKEKGDEAFERSKARAQAALDLMQEEAKRGRMDKSAALRVYKEKTGAALVAVPTSTLRKVFDGEVQKCSMKWLGFRRYTVAKFTDWLEERKIKTVLDVTVAHAKEFLDGLYDPQKPLYTARTVRGMRSIVAMALSRLLPEGAPNPFRHETLKIERAREDAEAHRKPLNEEELARLLEVAKEMDAEAYDWMVCAVSTGLRRGDVCALEWRGVDLKAGTLHVRTRKTGAELCLPILPLLEGVLKRRKTENGDGRFVFPEAESLMRRHPNGVTYRVKKIFATAFADPADEEADAKPWKKLSDVLDDVLAMVQKLKTTPKKRKQMEAVLSLYARGISCRQIEQEIGLSRMEANGLLKKAEDAAGILFIRRARMPRGNVIASIAKVTQTKREFGRYAASRYDFHCLRTTFVTLAISRGVNIDILRALTGHATVELVMRHYFKPKGSDFAEELKRAMPAILTT